MSKTGVHLIVQGRVQGIGFRYFCQMEAVKLSITGYAKNLINGDVEVIAEGESDRIELFINTIKQNHPYAMVINTIQKDLLFTGKYREFSIKF